MTKRICVSKSELHLAAYMKANGANLQAFNGREFVFETDTDVNSWRVKHSNSCCFQVDNEMLALKRMTR